MLIDNKIPNGLIVYTEKVLLSSGQHTYWHDGKKETFKSYLKAASLFLEMFLACKARLLQYKFKVKASTCKQVRSI